MRNASYLVQDLNSSCHIDNNYYSLRASITGRGLDKKDLCLSEGYLSESERKNANRVRNR